MRAIFEQGSLSTYSQVRLDDSRSPILEHSQYGARRTTVSFPINMMTLMT